MKNNSRKRGGFTLLEVMISMAIIAIISISVYNAYLLIIRQTKEGEVKQMAAVVGKESIEGIKSVKVFNGTLSLEDKDIGLNKIEDTYTTIVHLDKDFKLCQNQSSTDYIYLQEITLTPTKDSNNDKINIDKNIESNNSSTKNILEDHLYLSKQGSTLYIKDTDNTDSPIINQTSELGIYIYLKTKDNEKFITVKDYKGNTVLEEKSLGSVFDKSSNKENKVNLYFDFSSYTNASLKNIKIYISNKDEEENTETNIYLQKSSDLNINVNFNEGQGYIYNNQSGDSNKIGTLYDIKVRIWKKGDEDKEPLFTGYSNQNMIVN